jgi:hypothetical protein
VSVRFEVDQIKGNAMSLQHDQTINELLADPLIHMVMRADQVEPEGLRALLNSAASYIIAKRRERAAESSGVLLLKSLSRRGGRGLDAPLAARRRRRARDIDCKTAFCC